MFAFAIFFSDSTWSCNYIPEAEAQKIISERKDARFTVSQYQNGSKSWKSGCPKITGSPNQRRGMTPCIQP